MFKWLRRERSKPDTRERTVAIPPTPAASAQSSGILETSGSPLPELAVDPGFYKLLLGVHSLVEHDLNALESRVSRELDQIVSSGVSQSSLVPRVPAVIPRLMQSLRSDTATGAEIAEQVGRDATLVADVLRLANSPYYRTGREINSLEQAVFILGRNGLRQLVANAAMKPLLNIQTGHFSRQGGPIIWAQAEKCAIAGRCLAKAEGLDQFEAYLAGLVQNIGLIVAIQQLDAAFDATEAARSYRFRDIFAAKSRILSVRIAAEWELPDRVLTAIKEQSPAGQPDDMSPLGRVLFAGDKLSKLRVLVDEGRIEDAVERLQCGAQGQFRDRCVRCYAEL